MRHPAEGSWSLRGSPHASSLREPTLWLQLGQLWWNHVRISMRSAHAVPCLWTRSLRGLFPLDYVSSTRSVVRYELDKMVSDALFSMAIAQVASCRWALIPLGLFPREQAPSIHSVTMTRATAMVPDAHFDMVITHATSCRCILISQGVFPRK